MTPIKLRLDRRGSATMLMVFMVTVIMTVGLGFNWLVKEHLQASENLKNKAEAIVKARSAYDTLIYLLLRGRTMPREVVLSGTEDLTLLQTLPLDNAPIPFSDDVTVRIQDSNGLISLATINTAAMQQLLQRVLSVDSASVPLASLQDWTDQDDLTRLNGAESSYYRSHRGLPPRNYALQYMDELGFVRGMTPEGYERLRSYLTMLPATGFNPNTAPDEVMMAFLDITEETLQRIKDFKAEHGVITEGALQLLTGRMMAKNRKKIYFKPSPFMDISVSAGQPKAMYTIKAGLSLRQNNIAPYSVLYWREE